MYSMVYATAPNEEEGMRICTAVVERRLAACANTFPIRSVYWWKGKVERDSEQALIFKTRSELVPGLISMVEKESSYDVPCAVAYEMSNGSARYLEWIDENTRT